MVLSASFGAEVFDCESLGFGFERQDVDADGGILFFEDRDLFCKTGQTARRSDGQNPSDY